MERLIGKDSAEIVRLRMRRLRSPALCRRILERKANKSGITTIDDQLLNKKAEGLSAAVDSALGYLETKASDLNSRVLSRYYGLMQLTIAEQVGSLDNDNDLAKIQGYSEKGHGLYTIPDKEIPFPEGFYVYVTKDGYFSSYAKIRGIKTISFAFDGRKRTFKKEDIGKYVSLIDLFRRIPELKEQIPEYFDQEPLCFMVRDEGKKAEFDKRFEEEIDANRLEGSSQISGMNHEYIQIYPQTDKLTLEQIREYKWPFDGIVEAENIIEQKKYFVGRLYYNTDPFEVKKGIFYSSDYSLLCYMIPLFRTIEDPILVNLMLTYALSIVVRYMPDTWFRILKGDLNHLGSLIEYYMSVFDRVIQIRLLSRITGESIYILSSDRSYASPDNK